MPVYMLDEKKISFPYPELADEDGLLAVGGDLRPERLLLAYSNGIFPWYNPGEIIQWWCPKERFIIRPSEIHISKSMKKYLRKHKTYVVINRDFYDTMHRCRLKREFEEGTWISDEMEKAYHKLYEKGYAIIVEAYVDDKLAGGLYGVVIGRCFFGESMFSDVPNGSKVALILLAEILSRLGFVMIDCQLPTKHLRSMGGIDLSWEDYKKLLKENTF